MKITSYFKILRAWYIPLTNSFVLKNKAWSILFKKKEEAYNTCTCIIWACVSDLTDAQVALK